MTDSFPPPPPPAPALPTWATNPADAPTPGVGFGQAIRLFFRKYAQFTGRASLSEFWWSMLFITAVNLVVYVPGILLTVFGGVVIGQSASSSSAASGAGGGVMLAIGIVLIVLVGLFSLAVLIPSISVAVRRLHDANFSGLFYLFNLAGLGIVVLVMCVLPSNPLGQRFDRPA